jgi:hypothetical protein
MNTQANTTQPKGEPTVLTLAAVLETLRRPEVARPMAAALGVDDLEQAFRVQLYDLDRLVYSMRQTAFGMLVLSEGLAAGLGLAQPEADGLRGLVGNMEQPIQAYCDKINQITGYNDY